MAHKGFPAITALRLLGSLTRFTDDKTEAERGAMIVQSHKVQGQRHGPIHVQSQQEGLSRNLARAGASWEVSNLGLITRFRNPRQDGGGVALRGLQGNSSRATRPSSEPFPSGQVLEWAQELDRWGARPGWPSLVLPWYSNTPFSASCLRPT